MSNLVLFPVVALLLGILIGALTTTHYKITSHITSPMVQSYLRHLVVTVVAIIMATSSAHHVTVLAFTRAEWLESANALWLAVLPSLRHLIERKVPAIAPLVENELPKNVFPVPVTPPTATVTVTPDAPAPVVTISAPPEATVTPLVPQTETGTAPA